MPFADQFAWPAKLQIGVPTYGRAWTKKNNGSYVLSGTCPNSNGSASERRAWSALTDRAAVTAAEVPNVLTRSGVPESAVTWDPQAQESWFEYDKAVTWTDGSGATQTCTARRISWFVGPDAAYLQAGAGIVADSDPDDEDLECRNKAAALLAAVPAARRMTRRRREGGTSA